MSSPSYPLSQLHRFMAFAIRFLGNPSVGMNQILYRLELDERIVAPSAPDYHWGWCDEEMLRRVEMFALCVRHQGCWQPDARMRMFILCGNRADITRPSRANLA